MAKMVKITFEISEIPNVLRGAELLCRLLKLLNTLQYRSRIFFSHYLIHLPFAVGYAVVPYVGKLGFAAHHFLNFINMLYVYKVYAAANVCYFNKDGIHGAKVGN